MKRNPLFSETEMRSRENKVISTLGKKDVDISFIFNRPDLFYYSGTGLDGIVQVNDKLSGYVKRNVDLASEISNLDIRKMDSFRLFKQIAKETQVESIGLELDILPYKTVQYIQKAFDCKIIDISKELRMIRSVKSDDELKIMRLAAKQTDDSFEYIQDFIKPGITELDLSIKVEGFLRSQGHPGMNNIRTFQHNFTTQSFIMAGENTQILNTSFGPVSGVGVCNMHMNGPSKRKIKNNEAVLIDTTGVMEGYTADETITFFLGNPDKQLLDAYEVAKEVHKLAEKTLISGNKASDVYNKMVDLVTEAGYNDHFMGKKNDKVGFIGHGIGLELDEFPVITPGYKNELIKGQVVALEPKFIIAGSGVGLEQDYIIGDKQAERITHFAW